MDQRKVTPPGGVMLSRATVEQLAWTLDVMSQVCGQVSSLSFLELKAHYRSLFGSLAQSAAAATRALQAELNR